MLATLGLVLVAVVAIGMGLWIAERRGRAKAERDFARASADRAKDRNEIDTEVSRLPDADLDRRLRGDK